MFRTRKLWGGGTGVIPMQGAAWTPATATTEGGALPAAWWDASQIVGLVNNDPVTTWSDLRGTYHVSNTLTARPTYLTNQVNGLPAVSFDTTNDVLIYSGAFITGAAARHVFVVGKATEAAGNNNIYLQWGAYNPSALFGVGNFVHMNCYNTLWRSTTGASTSAFSLVEAQYNGGAIFTTGKMWLNGASVTRTGTTDNTLNTGSTQIDIGNMGMGANFYAKLIAEILIYGAALSAADRAQVASYLGAKYAITFS